MGPGTDPSGSGNAYDASSPVPAYIWILVRRAPIIALALALVVFAIVFRDLATAALEATSKK